MHTRATNVCAASYLCGEQFQERTNFTILYINAISSIELDRNKDSESRVAMPTQNGLPESGDSV